MPSFMFSYGSRHSPSHLRLLLCGAAAWAITGSAWALTPTMPVQGSADLSISGAGNLNAKILSGGAVTGSTIAYTSTGSTANVTLAAPRTLVDWTTFNVGVGNTLNFNFVGAGDLVLNRVPTGTAIAINGTINGKSGGVTAGNIWFLSDSGVFINGTVSAAGVLATNTLGVADLNLLTDPTANLKLEMRAAAGALIDVEGAAAATGAQLDSAGDIVLTGNSIGTSNIDLEATGTINQTTGTLATGLLEGASTGGAALSGANLIETLGSFANTASGNVSLVNAETLTLGSATVNNGPGNLTLTTTSGDIIATGGSILRGVNVTVRAAGAATVDEAYVVQDLDIQGGTNAGLGATATSYSTVGRDVTVTASNGAATMRGAVQAGDDITINASGDVIGSNAALTTTGQGQDVTSNGSNISVTSSGGIQTLNLAQADVAGTNASGNVTLQASGAVSLMGGRADHGDLNITGNSLSLRLGLAGHNVNLIASIGGATVGGAMAGNDVLVTAAGGAVNVAQGLSGGRDVIVSGTGATLAQDGAVAGRDVKVATTSGDASLRVGLAGRDVVATGSNAVAVVNGAEAGRDIIITASNGAATVTGAYQAGDDIKVSATGGDVAGLNAALTTTGHGQDVGGDGSNILARSTQGNAMIAVAQADVAGVNASGSVTVTATNIATLNSGRADFGGVIVTGAAATLGDGLSGHDIVVSASRGDATVIGTAVAQNDVTVSAPNGAVTVNQLEVARDASIAGATTTLGANNTTLGTSAVSNVGRDLTVTSSNGAANVNGYVAAGDKINISATGGDAVLIAGLTTTGMGPDVAGTGANIIVKSTTGAVQFNGFGFNENNPDFNARGSYAEADVTGANAAGSVSVNAVTNADANNASAPHGNLTVAGSGVSVLEGIVGHDIALQGSTGTARGGYLNAGNNIRVTSTNNAVGVVTAAIAGQDLILDSGGGEAVLQTGTAGRDLTITAMTHVQITAGATAGRDLTVNAGTDAVLLPSAENQMTGYDDVATVGRDLGITAGTSISLGAGDTSTVATVGRDATLTASNGGILVGQISAGDKITLAGSGGEINAFELDATGKGQDLANSGANVVVRAITGAATVDISNADVTGANPNGGSITIRAHQTATLHNSSAPHGTVTVTGNLAAP